MWEDDLLDDSAEPLAETRMLGSVLRAQFGRFKVRSLLGSGAHATVYKVYDPVLQRDVALKVPHFSTQGGAAVTARFLGEARALARLRHPAIVPVFESGRHGDLPYVATAFIDGKSLDKLIAAGPIRFARAAEIAATLADALDYAHEHGVIHRDVKPANVMVEPDGSVQLTDFGLAQRHDAPDVSRSGVIIGTPAYLAPEQAASGDYPADPSADQYSLGVVLFELICGRPPFLGPPALVLYSAQFDDPLLPRALRPGVPAELERICRKAMARRPEDRYASCKALAEDLRNFLARVDADTRRRAVGRRRAESLRKATGWLRERPAAAFSTALALIGLTASAILAAALVATAAPMSTPAEPADLPSPANASPLLAGPVLPPVS